MTIPAYVHDTIPPAPSSRPAYLNVPPARPVVMRAARSLPPRDQARMVVRELPAAAVMEAAS